MQFYSTFLTGKIQQSNQPCIVYELTTSKIRAKFQQNWFEIHAKFTQLLFYSTKHDGIDSIQLLLLLLLFKRKIAILLQKVMVKHIQVRLLSLFFLII